jgi:hypothetical protein
MNKKLIEIMEQEIEQLFNDEVRSRLFDYSGIWNSESVHDSNDFYEIEKQAIKNFAEGLLKGVEQQKAFSSKL